MKITASQLRRIISEEVSAAISESPIFAASSMVGMKGKGGGAPKLVTLKTASGDHEVLNVDQKTGKMRVRKKGSSASPFDVSASDVKQVVEGRRSLKSLLEGHARITEEEMAAWKSGDWGFTSQHDGGHDHQEFLHGHESGHPGDDEGDMVKGRMASLKKMAAEICDMLDPDDQLPAWVQDLLATSHNDVRHVHDYLSGVKGPAKHPMGESRLSEGHSRITQEEFSAWKRGDWGFVSEGLEGMKEMTGEEAAAFIASKDPNDTVEQDVIDSETGEIYAEKGRTYGDAYIHPQHSRKRPASVPYEDDVTDQFQYAVKEFSQNFLGMDLSELGVEPEDAVHDLAANFFYEYPQWEEWADELGMSKSEMNSAVAESIYEALMEDGG